MGKVDPCSFSPHCLSCLIMLFFLSLSQRNANTFVPKKFILTSWKGFVSWNGKKKNSNKTKTPFPSVHICSSVNPTDVGDPHLSKSVSTSDIIYVCPTHLAYPATSVKSRGVFLMLRCQRGCHLFEGVHLIKACKSKVQGHHLTATLSYKLLSINDNSYVPKINDFLSFFLCVL